ncbi:S-adenosylmethionine transporter [Irpex rosettiformis]|uniref:S-adenosylmethionine transporter n=1 Tax=Irpex rosettiformis TaxID=378272 RepID=A0ACB8TYE2_9APHY|nr:S-adenosylmethionine transporter [Irpex rosettiformis]
MSDGAEPSRKGPTFYQSLISGGLAGTSVDLLFFPIDTVKTRLQSSQGFLRAGGFKGIYNGVGSVIVGSAPGAALFFCTYDTLKKHTPLPAHMVSMTHMLAASLGEVTACLVRVPTEVIKTRMQTASYGNLAHSSFSAAKLVLGQEGIRGFYRGFGITIMREIPFTSLQFPLYEWLKLRLSEPLGGRKLYAHEAAVCGSVAGGFAAAATTPLDVLKTRIMLDIKSTSKTSHLSIFSRTAGICRNEGIGALFSGVVPRTMWISTGGAVFLGVYEWAIHGLSGY